MVISRFILLFGIIILLACSNSDVAQDEELAVPVTVEEIKLKSIESYVSATGNVYAVKNVVLKSESAGYYRLAINPKTDRQLALGDHVNAGQTIIFLDNPEVENSIKIESQKLNLEISQREFEKQQKLYEKGGVTLREFKDSERLYIDAKYNHDNALIQLAKLQIKTPFTGIIVDLPYYTERTKVEANSPMARVMDYHQLLLDVNLPGQEMERVQVGKTVRVMNYTLPEDTLTGKITQVSPAIDPDTRSFKSSILIENPAWLLRPGMFVKADIIVATRDSAIVIPKDILMAKQRGKTVFVVEKGAAEERIIEVGLENPAVVEVISGLKVDERLVVKGFETLRDHSKVKIIR